MNHTRRNCYTCEYRADIKNGVEKIFCERRNEFRKRAHCGNCRDWFIDAVTLEAISTKKAKRIISEITKKKESINDMKNQFKSKMVCELAGRYL